MENKKYVKGALEVADTQVLKQMMEPYWLEIIPHSDVIQDHAKRERYFTDRFEPKTRKGYLGTVEDKPMGFVVLSIYLEKQFATIDDFYVLPEMRRKGYGTVMVQAIYKLLDQQNIERIDLTVRRDTPQALAFWEAQGFRIAHYQLRQYRDPENGASFIGALSSEF